jgi:hypothetical protein
MLTLSDISHLLRIGLILFKISLGKILQSPLDFIVNTWTSVLSKISLASPMFHT